MIVIMISRLCDDEKDIIIILFIYSFISEIISSHPVILIKQLFTTNKAIQIKERERQE